MCVCSVAAPLCPTQRGRKSSLESPIHLKHNGTPQRFSSCFPVCPTHLPPQGRMEGQPGVTLSCRLSSNSHLPPKLSLVYLRAVRPPAHPSIRKTNAFKSGCQNKLHLAVTDKMLFVLGGTKHLSQHIFLFQISVS